VPEDLRFNYSENEIGFWYEDSAVEDVFQFKFQGLDGCEDDDDKE
jgi:hypothetical protein